MIRLGVDFFPPHIKAYVSDVNCDFKLPERFSGLTPHQQDYLRPYGLQDTNRWVHLRQVHGKAFVVIDESKLSLTHRVMEADAAVTALTRAPISVRTADCQSIFIYAADCDIIAVIHAGWQGARLKIAAEVVGWLIRSQHCNPEFIKAAFGPSIRSCCYEIGEDVAEFFPDSVKLREGRMYLDLINDSRRQLTASGIAECNLWDCGFCTFCDSRFFSYRRQKERAGRMIAVMVKG